MNRLKVVQENVEKTTKPTWFAIVSSRNQYESSSTVDKFQ